MVMGVLFDRCFAGVRGRRGRVMRGLLFRLAGDGTPGTAGSMRLGRRTWAAKTGAEAYIVRPSFPGAVGVGRADGQCVPLHTGYRQVRRHLPHDEQRSD